MQSGKVRLDFVKVIPILIYREQVQSDDASSRVECGRTKYVVFDICTLHLSTLVTTCLHLFTPVYTCSKIITPVYACLPLFMLVYPGLNLFTLIYACLQYTTL